MHSLFCTIAILLIALQHATIVTNKITTFVESISFHVIPISLIDKDFDLGSTHCKKTS